MDYNHRLFDCTLYTHEAGTLREGELPKYCVWF
jgi:hypothetical protein